MDRLIVIVPVTIDEAEVISHVRHDRVTLESALEGGDGLVLLFGRGEDGIAQIGRAQVMPVTRFIRASVRPTSTPASASVSHLVSRFHRYNTPPTVVAQKATNAPAKADKWK